MTTSGPGPRPAVRYEVGERISRRRRVAVVAYAVVVVVSVAVAWLWWDEEVRPVLLMTVGVAVIPAITRTSSSVALQVDDVGIDWRWGFRTRRVPWDDVQRLVLPDAHRGLGGVRVKVRDEPDLRLPALAGSRQGLAAFDGLVRLAQDRGIPVEGTALDTPVRRLVLLDAVLGVLVVAAVTAVVVYVRTAA